MRCIVCEKETNWFAGTKVKDGHLCPLCTSKLPSLFLKRGRELSRPTLLYVMQKTAENMDRFSATASYGDLHIDELHGLFCVAKALTPDGKPTRDNNVFRVCDLTETGLTCASPHERKNVVYVNVELTCEFADPEFRFNEPIKRQCRCKSKRIDKNNVSWEEPPDMLMFRSMFNHLVTSTCEKVNSVLCGKSVHEFELEKARSLFMLDEGYTSEELNLSYSRLKSVYGAGNGDGEDNREMSVINRYCWLLQSCLERGAL